VYCEIHMVLKGVNISLHVYSTLIFRFGFNSVYACAHNFVSFIKIGAENAPFLLKWVSLWKKRKPWYILCTPFTILFFHRNWKQQSVSNLTIPSNYYKNSVAGIAC
jgi:hypothetical protein